MEKISTRQRRFGQLIQQELTLLIREKAEDPVLRSVVITAVHVAADLSVAKVYISDICDDIKASLKACAKAARFLRFQLAQRVDLRTVPELVFKADTSLSNANKLSQLIDQACAEDDNFKQQAPADHDDDNA